MNYGIELEFFVVDMADINKPIPAYKSTNNIDGNPILGEIRTKIHDNICDCVFELKKLLYREETQLIDNKRLLRLASEMRFDKDTLLSLRKDALYSYRKEMEVLEEKSIYPNGKTGKFLPRDLCKASLQINFSENKDITYPEYEKVQVEDKYKYVSSTRKKSYSGLFDYVSIIAKLDKYFANDIAEAGRVKGVYAIKSGELGDRIEYRSLPNTVNLDSLMAFLK
jgi:hypothetical protein